MIEPEADSRKPGAVSAARYLLPANGYRLPTLWERE